MSKTDPRWHYVALFAVCVLGGFGPYAVLLSHYPEGDDAVKWATSAALVNPEWFDWVFKSRHFIGYRPVTAFSFTLNHAFTGWSPMGYRLTNTALHIAAGLAVYGAFRVLARDKGWWAVVAAAFFFAHPSAETVVPHLARRSYLLGSFFSVLALTVWVSVLRTGRPLRSMRAAVAYGALAIAVLSNEIAFVVVPILVMVTLSERPRDRPWTTAVLRCLPIAALTAGLIALRYVVLGHMGGYHRRYFAFTQNNHNMIREVDDTPYQIVFEAAWRYLFFPTGAHGEQALLLGGAFGMVIALGVAAYYLWRGLVAPLLSRADDDQIVILLLLLWIGGHAVLYALTRNWFWRQSYPMLAPFALLVTLIARDTWAAYNTPARRVLHLMPQGILLLSVLAHSPAVHGVNARALKGQFKSSALVADIQRALPEHPEDKPLVIYLAMPVRGPAIRDALLWLRRQSSPPKPRFVWLGMLQPGSKEFGDEPVVDIVEGNDRSRVVLRAHGQWEARFAKGMNVTDKKMIRTDRLSVPGAQSFVYISDGTGGHELWPVPAAVHATPAPRNRQGRKKSKKAKGQTSP
jgi:hypothetical protein